MFSLAFYSEHTFMNKKYIFALQSLQHIKIVNFDNITNENKTNIYI